MEIDWHSKPGMMYLPLGSEDKGGLLINAISIATDDGSVFQAVGNNSQIEAGTGKLGQWSRCMQVRTGCDWGAIDTTVLCDDSQSLFHWETRIETTKSIRIATLVSAVDFWAHDKLLPVRDIAGTSPFSGPTVFVSEDMNLGRKLLFFIDYTSLQEYLQLVGVSPLNAVTPSKTGCVYRPPLNRETGLYIPAGNSLMVVSAYLKVSEGGFEDPTAAAISYLQAFSEVYDRLSRPETVYTDWREIARLQTRDLDHPDCWQQLEGSNYLRAYYKAPASDCLTQVEIWSPAKSWAMKSGEGRWLSDRIEDGIHRFYHPEVGRVTNSITWTSGSGQYSVWYELYDLLTIGRFAHTSDVCRRLLLDSAKAVLQMGPDFSFSFPRIASYQTNERIPEPGDEYVNGGAYAYVMLQTYSLTGERKYLDAAAAGIRSIKGRVFQVPAEGHMLGASICAGGWLYALTGDREFLALSLEALAGLVQITWFWECDYGWGEFYRTFMLQAATTPNCRMGLCEQSSNWEFLLEYYGHVRGALPAFADKLVSEFIKYTLTVSRSSYPPFLPRHIIHPGVPGRPTRPELWIPLEDVSDGRYPPGQIGQAIYFGGAPYRYAAGAYTYFDQAELVVYSEYPFAESPHFEIDGTLAFSLGGTDAYEAIVALLPRNAELPGCWRYGVEITYGRSLRVRRVTTTESGGIWMRLSGGTSYRLRPLTVAQVQQCRQAPADSKPPVSVGLSLGNELLVRPGEATFVTLSATNQGSRPMGVSIQCLLPEDWQSDGDYLRHTAVLDVPPCCQRQFRLRLKAPNRERAVGFAEIRTFVGGDLLTALPLHLETVSEVAFGEIANYAELWQQASPTGTWPSPVPGTIHNGPRGVTITGTAARKLTVDLDATPIVELQLESGGSDWFCYLTDGRSVPTLLELNVGGSGLLTYDMVRATGWQGLRRFSFCLHVVRGEVLVRSMRFRPR